MKMHVGLVEMFDGTPNRQPGYVRDFSQAVEANGFRSLWVPEHVVFFESYQSVYPYPPTPGSAESPKLEVGSKAGIYDPLLLCQAIAMSTTTLRVGTSVALLPLRHPLMWAREVATVDHFSDGRFDFGIGLGWLKEEFDALNVAFNKRGKLTDEYLGALKAAWTQDASTYHGEFVDFTDALSFPKPVQQPHPPIFIGGESDAALRRVARFGDGWFGWNMTGPELEANLERLDAELAKVGRTREAVSIHVGLRHQGSLDEIARWADVYSALGVEQMMVAMRIPTKIFAERLSDIASAVGLR